MKISTEAVRSTFPQVRIVEREQLPQIIDQTFDALDLRPGMRMLEINPHPINSMSMIAALKGVEVVSVFTDRKDSEPFRFGEFLRHGAVFVSYGLSCRGGRAGDAGVTDESKESKGIISFV